MRRRASKYPKARACGAVSCDWNKRILRSDWEAYLSSRSCRRLEECGNGKMLQEVPSQYYDQ